MKKKTAAIATSVASMAICASLIAGSTYALFTSESNVDIAVTAGKVAVVAEARLNEEATSTYEGKVTQNEETGAFTVQNVLPGDKIAIDVFISNTSTVTAKYRTETTLTDATGAWIVSIDGVTYRAGESAASLWRTLAAKTNPEKPVRITVALDENEENQNAACNISCIVRAIQGNANVTDSVLEAYNFADASQNAIFCPDCYNYGTPHEGHEPYFDIADGVAGISRTGAWFSPKDLNWDECYYQFGYDVDVSTLEDGQFIAFDQGETVKWQDMQLGIKNEGGKYFAYNTAFENQCASDKLLGEVAPQFRVTATFKQAGQKFLQALSLSGLGEVVNVSSSAVAPGICWDVYTVSEGATAALDNFEFAELSWKSVNAADFSEALKSNTVVTVSEDIETITIPDGLQNATINGNGKAVNKFTLPADTNATVTVKNVKFTANEVSKEAGVYINENNLSGQVVFEHCTFEGYAKAVQVGGSNNDLSVLFSDCIFECGNAGKTYGFQGFGSYKDVTIKNCTFNDCVSWAILIQGSFGEQQPVVIEDCTFNNCQSGLFKTTGTIAKFTFKNNTVNNSCGHDGKEAEWFWLTTQQSGLTVSGNTKDGEAWEPAAEQGIKLA